MNINEIVSSEFPNYESYAKYTKSNDWRSICQINDVNYDTFGTKKELKVLSDYLERGEVVFALSSGIMSQTQTSNAFDWGTNTWLVALTNERFLFLDHAMMTKSVDTQSVHHDSVQAVSASQGLMLGKIQVDLGSRVIVVDNCQKASVKAMAGIANKWLRIYKKIQNKNVTPVKAEASEELRELISLNKIQIENQQKIIELLEEIKLNDASFYSRVSTNRKKTT